MFQPLPLFIGLRYVRSRQHRFFVSLITWVSLVGVCLGVAALIVILSVMNGFESELRQRLLALGPQARVLAPGPPSADGDPALRERLQRLPGVRGVAPYIELTALAVHGTEMLPVNLRGIVPALERRVNDVQPLLVAGSEGVLKPGSEAVILGRDIADQLGVGVGDHIRLLVPMLSSGGVPEPQEGRFTVGGVFEAGIADPDESLILASRADVRALAPQAEGASGLALSFADPLEVGRFMPAVRAAAPAGYRVRDWTQDNADYFHAIRIEKTMMGLILLLIVAVAAFNIVAMLVMVVGEKRADIAILRTFGTAPLQVMRVFVVQGLVIGWAGVAAGIALGVLLAANVSRIVPALERLFHFQFLSPSVYYITAIPSELNVREVLWISAAALLLTLLSTLYPALRAARTPPAEALRYE